MRSAHLEQRRAQRLLQVGGASVPQLVEATPPAQPVQSGWTRRPEAAPERVSAFASLLGRGGLRPALIGAAVGLMFSVGVAQAQITDTRVRPPAVVQAVFDASAELARIGVDPPVVDTSAFTPRSMAQRNGLVEIRYPGAQAGTSTTVQLQRFSAYAPQTTPRALTLADTRVMEWLRAPDAGDADNYEATDHRAVAAFVERFLRDEGRALAQLGIGDARALTPRQAANLAGLITTLEMRYNNTALDFGGVNHPFTTRATARLAQVDAGIAERAIVNVPPNIPEHVQRMDVAGVQAFFDVETSADNPKAETGVCRNYTETFQAVWDALRAMQDPATTQLANTYVKIPEGMNHVWIALYTVQPDGTILGTQLDPTWADKDGIRATTVQRELDLEVGERALFAFQHLHMELNGLTFSRLFEDYTVVSIVAHDLAAHGRANDGAELMIAFLSRVPDVTRQDWAKDLSTWRDNVRAHKRWYRPGAEALVRALETRLPADLRGN